MIRTRAITHENLVPCDSLTQFVSNSNVNSSRTSTCCVFFRKVIDFMLHILLIPFMIKLLVNGREINSFIL